MDLPEIAFDPEDAETRALVHLIYHRNFFTPESEMTKARVTDCWHKINLPKEVDGLTMSKICGRIEDQFIVQFRQMGRHGPSGLRRLKFATPYIYFRSSKDASMAKLSFS